MAYRRRQQQGVSRPSSTFEGFEDEGIWNPPPPPSSLSSSLEDAPSDFRSSFPSSPSLAAKAIRASSAHRDSSLSSAYSNLSNASLNTVPTRTASPPSKDSRTYEYASMKKLNESKHGFWDVLARKAKSILDDDNVDQQHETYERTGSQMPGTKSRGKFSNSNHLEESNIRRDSSKLLKGLGAITSSLSHIGGTIGNALGIGMDYALFFTYLSIVTYACSSSASAHVESDWKLLWRVLQLWRIGLQTSFMKLVSILRKSLATPRDRVRRQTLLLHVNNHNCGPRCKQTKNFN